MMLRWILIISAICTFILIIKNVDEKNYEAAIFFLLLFQWNLKNLQEDIEKKE